MIGGAGKIFVRSLLLLVLVQELQYSIQQECVLATSSRVDEEERGKYHYCLVRARWLAVLYTPVGARNKKRLVLTVKQQVVDSYTVVGDGDCSSPSCTLY